MSGMELCRGQIVRSGAGRDAGKFFVVLAVEGDFVQIVNGDLRPCERPKKKKIRHIHPTKTVLVLPEPLTNKWLKQNLLAYAQNEMNAN